MRTGFRLRASGFGLAFAYVLVLGPAAAADDGPAAPTAPALPDEPYRTALAAIGLSERDLRIDADLVQGFAQDRFRLPLGEYLWKDARRAPGVVEALREHALEAAAQPSEAVLFGGTRIQARVRRSLIDDPLKALAERAREPDALAEAILALRRAGGGGEPTREEVFETRRTASLVAAPIAEQAALVLLAEIRFLGWRERAFEKLTAREQESLVVLAGFMAPQGETAEGQAAWAVLEGAAARVDFAALAAGAFDVALAAERAAAELSNPPVDPGVFGRFTADTPFGRVEIDGRGVGTTRTADAPPALFLLDLHGDDRYASAGAARGRAAPVSVVIDLAGDDVYDTGDPALGHTFGAGVLGLGILIDRAGNDRYRGGPFALGVGFFGFGILCDQAGDDAYDGGAFSQGAALFGAGVLRDAGGADRYHARDRAQGYGGPLGAGLLADLAGDDLYVAEDTKIHRPSPQTREHNASLAQGAASGHRADFADGRSLAGGFGMLADGGGNDVYRAGVFAQGVGYWYGVGVLADRAGDDSYEGVWYVQGAAVHFAAGVLHDGGGHDRYRASHQVAQGAGHDLSLGFLYERAGDDRYEAGPLSLGAAGAGGLGVLVERGGDDRYAISRPDASALGRSETLPNKPYDLRRWNRTLGVFLDLGGRDEYPSPSAPAGPANGRTWIQLDPGAPDDLNARGALGVGLDR